MHRDREARDTRFRYFRDAPEDRKWGIWATSTGFVNIKPGESYPPPGHPEGYTFNWENGRILDEFQIHFIARGSGYFEDKLTYRSGVSIHAGDIFILFPGVWHRYTTVLETGWLEYWIGVKGRIADDILRHRFIRPATPLFNASNSQLILNLFAEGVARVEREEPGLSRVLGSLAALIMAQICADTEAGKEYANRKRDIVWEAKIHLQQNFHRKLDGRELASLLNVGYHWLRRAFKDETGLSINQYILQLRIIRGKQLLLRTDMTLAEIAADAGFSDANYFSRMFKEKTDSAPGEWRKHHERHPHFSDAGDLFPH